MTRRRTRDRTPIERAKALRSLCEPECYGRCAACPADVVTDLIAECERLVAENEHLRALPRATKKATR